MKKKLVHTNDTGKYATDSRYATITFSTQSTELHSLLEGYAFDSLNPVEISVTTNSFCGDFLASDLVGPNPYDVNVRVLFNTTIEEVMWKLRNKDFLTNFRINGMRVNLDDYESESD